jgi:hypothetical protein
MKIVQEILCERSVTNAKNNPEKQANLPNWEWNPEPNDKTICSIQSKPYFFCG